MTLKGKRILITGSNGFIGSHLVDRLIKEGADIHCIIRGKSKRIPKDIRYYESDLKGYDNLNQIIHELNPEIIFHLAASTNNLRDKASIKKTFEANVQGTINLLLTLDDISYNQFIFISTSELYGDENKTPFNEGMKIKAMSQYSASKICAESYCNLFSKVFNKPILIVRLPIVYGPGQKGGMFIPDLMRSIKEQSEFSMTKGEQGRDFIYVDDVVDALILSCKRDIKGLFNIGSGEEVPMKDIIKLLGKDINIKVRFDKPYRENEIWHYCLDISRIKRILEWKPKTSLKEGLKKTLEWWKVNG